MDIKDTAKTFVNLVLLFGVILSVDGSLIETRLQILEQKIATNMLEMSLLSQRSENIEDRLSHLETNDVTTIAPPEHVGVVEHSHTSGHDKTYNEIYKAFAAEKIQRLNLEQKCADLENRLMNFQTEHDMKLQKLKREIILEVDSKSNNLSNRINSVHELVKSNTNDLYDKLELYNTNTMTVTNVSNLLDMRKVSFSARLRSKIDNLAPDSTLILNDILTNHGNAYSGTTGIFTAPLDGTYVFFVHILGTDRSLEMRLNKNSTGIMYLYINGIGHGADGNMVVLQLKKGDTINVVKHGPHGSPPFYVHHSWTTFSGFMIYTN